MRFVVGLAVVSLVAIAACASIVGLSDYEVVGDADGGNISSSSSSGTTPPGTEGGGPVGTDGGPLPDPPDAQPDRDPSCTCAAAPSGWTRVAYANDRSAPCPDAVGASDLVAEPTVADAGACGCATCEMTLPSCATGTWSTMYDNNSAPQCNIQGTAHFTKSGECDHTPGTLGDHHRVIAPSPSGASSCTADGVVVGSAITTRSVRVCNAGSNCPCEVSSPFASCVKAPGNVACPADFPTKHLVGTGATATCGACSCALANVKCNGTITYYDGANCGTPVGTVNSTDCLPVSAHNFDSVKFIADAATATCNTTPPAASAAGVTEPSTICCP